MPRRAGHEGRVAFSEMVEDKGFVEEYSKEDQADKNAETSQEAKQADFEEEVSKSPDERVEEQGSRISEMRRRGMREKSKFDNSDLRANLSEKWQNTKSRLRGFAGSLKRRARDAGFIALGAGAQAFEGAKNMANNAQENIADTIADKKATRRTKQEQRAQERQTRAEQNAAYASYAENIDFTARQERIEQQQAAAAEAERQKAAREAQKQSKQEVRRENRQARRDKWSVRIGLGKDWVNSKYEAGKERAGDVRQEASKRGKSFGEALKGKWNRFKDTVKAGAEAVGNAAQAGAEWAGNKARSAAESASNAVQSGAEWAQDKAQKAGETAQRVKNAAVEGHRAAKTEWQRGAQEPIREESVDLDNSSQE